MPEQCPKCRSTDQVKVGLKLDGRDVAFSHCRDCEQRWYTTAAGERRLSLDEVLALAAA